MNEKKLTNFKAKYGESGIHISDIHIINDREIVFINNRLLVYLSNHYWYDLTDMSVEKAYKNANSGGKKLKEKISDILKPRDKMSTPYRITRHDITELHALLLAKQYIEEKDNEKKKNGMDYRNETHGWQFQKSKNRKVFD